MKILDMSKIRGNMVHPLHERLLTQYGTFLYTGNQITTVHCVECEFELCGEYDKLIETAIDHAFKENHLVKIKSETFEEFRPDLKEVVLTGDDGGES